MAQLAVMSRTQNPSIGEGKVLNTMAPSPRPIRSSEQESSKSGALDDAQGTGSPSSVHL